MDWQAGIVFCSLAFFIYITSVMDFKKNIKFKIGSENWEMPLGILLLILLIALILMVAGALMGYFFGERQFQSSGWVDLSKMVPIAAL
jgi:uncharacterized integral membrane protein